MSPTRRPKNATKPPTAAARKPDAMDRDQRLLPALSQAALAVSRAQSPEDVYRIVGERMEQVGYQASIFILAEDSKQLRVTYLPLPKSILRAAEKLTGLSLKDYLYPLAEGGFYTRLLVSTETVFLEAIPNTAPAPVVEALPEALRPLACKLTDIFGIHHTLHAPLFVGGAPFGVLAVTGADLSEADVLAIAVFASQISTALDNLRLCEETGRWAGQLLQCTAEQTATLRESEDQYHNVVENASDGIVIVQDDVVKFVNTPLATLWGGTVEEIIGTNFAAYIHPAELPKVAERYRRRMAGEAVPRIYETILKCKDRSDLLVELHASVISFHGRPADMLFVRDITERKQSEEALREIQTRLQHVINSSSAILYSITPDFAATWVAQNVESILGYSVAESLAPGWWADHIHPDDRQRVFAGMPRVFEDGQHAHEYRFQLADGSYRWIHDELRLMHDGQDNPTEIIGTWHDVSERKQTEQALIEKEERYRTLFDLSPSGIVLLDLEGNIVNVNESFCQALGYTADELIGRNVHMLAAPEHRPNVDGDIALLRQTGKRYEHVIKDLHKDGSVRLMELRESMISLPDGQQGILVVADDITERKQAELELRENEERFHRLIAENADGIAVLDEQGTIRYVNPAAEALFNRPAQELLGMPLGIPVEDSNATVELNLPHGDQGELNTEVRFVASQWEGQTAYIATLRDVTARKQAEETMHLQSATLESTANSIVITDRGGIIQWVNPAFSALTGYTREEVIGQNPRLLKSGRQEPSFYEQMWDTILAGQVWHGEIINRRKDGSLYNEEMTITPVRAGSGEITHFIAVKQDITTRKRSEQALQRQLKELIVLNATAVAGAQAASQDELIQLITQTIGETFYPDNFGILLLDEQTKSLHAHSSYRGTLEESKQLLIAIGQGISGQVAANGLPRRVADVSREPGYLNVKADTRSELAVPIKAGERTIGVINTESTQLDFFSEADERLLVTIAGQLATSLESKRLFEETHRRLSELEALHTVSAALRAAQTRDEALPILLEQTLTALETEAGSIWLYQPASNELQIAVARGWFNELSQATLKPGQGIAGSVFASGQPYSTAEYATDALVLPANRLAAPAGWGGVCLPIRAGTFTVGVLFVSVPSTRQPTPQQMRLLTSLAEMAGATLQRMSLHDEMLRQLGQLQALHNIDRAITASMDLRMTLDTLLEQAANQLNVDATSLLLLNPHQHTLEYAAGHGFLTRAVQASRIRLGEGFAGRAALERHAVQVLDPAMLQGNPQFAALWTGEGFAAYIGMPLIAKGQVKGVLEVFHRSPLVPDPKWLEFLEILAGQAAIAIDNAQLFEGLQRSNVDLELAYDTTLEGWAKALELRDQETEGHSQRVTELTIQIARAMEMSEQELVHVRRGTLLHDMGKMGVPDDILLKPGKLTDEEWVLMRKHPQYAFDMLVLIPYLRPALDIPYCHHEKWDGSGYPRGLKGEQIPLAARIFAIVDVWDALTSDRPYRKAWSREKAISHIQEQAGSHFDPEIVQAFLKIMDENS